MAHQPRQQNTATTPTTAATAATVSSASNAAGSATITSAASGASATSTSQVHGITGGPGFNPNATHVSIPADGNPGEIVWTQPPIQSTSYYKIAPSDYVTFGWNFTNLIITPTALTVSAVGDNGNTYPVGPSNGVYPGNVQQITWDVYGYQQANPSLPLAQGEYTLMVFADGGPSAVPSPGYLAPNEQLRFALYTPQPYTPLASGWPCPGCNVNGALDQLKAHPASIALLTTLLVIFLSGFTTLRRVWD